jgi:hypothetical protein
MPASLVVDGRSANEAEVMSVVNVAPDTINVQPHPRLLSVLGDIEFAPWQCIAELVDNSFDEFLRNPAQGESPTVWVTLPARNSTPRDGEVWVKDNGPGMTLEQLNNALRAGWTSNDRFGQLGLFGVGFNIATARLGQVAVVRTAREEDPYWTVVTIDLKALAAGADFRLPVVSEPKSSLIEHGTEIVIRSLKPEHHQTVSRGQSKIKQILGDIYSHLLASRGFQLLVDGELVKPRLPCVWDQSRFVVRSNERIPAVIDIDESLPDRRVCLDCGRWQDVGDSNCESCGSSRVEVRERRIWGWVGIQRYSHLSDFGIDFIRNGRKILLRNRSLFNWDDPDDPTGSSEIEYPIEFPRGLGRIVGEIHVDHVRVNYQKNAFEYDTPEWKRVVRILRGDGPLRPKIGKGLGYRPNTSPLAQLFTGYRTNEPGLKDLIPGDGKVALHERAREWAEKFRKGDPDYQTDAIWYQAASQHLELKHTPKNDPPTQPGGDDGGDILITKGLLPTQSPAPAPTPESKSPMETEDDRRAKWRSSAVPLPDLDASFGLPGYGAPLQVRSWLVRGHRITRPSETGTVPVYVASGRGPNVEVFIDAEHPIFVDFGVDTRDLIVIELADFLRIRDNSSRAISAIFADLKDKCLPDHRIAGPFLTDLASRTLNRVRDVMLPVIAGNAAGYWGLLSADDKAAAERLFAVEGGSASWEDITASGEWVGYVPGAALVHLVEQRPDGFLDGRVFKSSFQPLATASAKRASADRIVDLLSDVATLADVPARRSPEELQRGRLACLLLSQEITESGEDAA